MMCCGKRVFRVQAPYQENILRVRCGRVELGGER